MTRNDFAERLLEKYRRNVENPEDEVYLKRIVTVGQVMSGETERRDAAVMLHFLMRQTGLEKDEENIDKAKVLKDLYDCRTCVDHVSQLYVKGIMPAAGRDVFGMRHIVDEEEADVILERLFDKSKRILP